MEKSGLNPSAALNIRGQARRKLIRFLGTCIATLWVAAHCGLASAQPTPAVADTGTVRISPLQAFNFLTLAQLDGLIDNQVKSAGGRVDWKPAFPAYVPTAEALRGGSIDIGSGSSTSFISAAADDHDLVVFAVERSSGKDQGIVATGASGIKTVADLVGKKVAVNQGGTGEYLLRLALEHNHIPIEKSMWSTFPLLMRQPRLLKDRLMPGQYGNSFLPWVRRSRALGWWLTPVILVRSIVMSM